jgi:hypothetical protein
MPRPNGASLEVVMVLTRSSSSRLLLLLLLVACLPLSGCAMIGGIFKAGVWAGVIMVVIVLAIVMFVVSKARG